MADSLWFLKRCDLFERLSPAELSRLESRSRIRTFPRNNPIYLPADAADGVLLLASGRVRICHFTADGKQVILGLIEPGELFGELSLLGQQFREDSAEAAENSTVILIPAEEISRLMAAHPEVSLAITKLIGFRRLRIERRLKSLLFRSNRERLIHLLLELAEQYGEQQANGIALRIKLSHQELANVIGSTRETVTLELGKLQNEGLLRTARQSVILQDIVALARSVDQQPPLVRPPASLQQPRRGGLPGTLPQPESP